MKRLEFCCATAITGVAYALGGIASAADLLDPNGEIRMTPKELAALSRGGGAVGSSHVAGIENWTLKGRPTSTGVYTIALRVPKNTKIQPHWHPDDRTATVVSGTWRIGYGEEFDLSRLKALPPGSFYTEPSRQGHFAQTLDQDVLVFITGYGPTGTTYYDQTFDPRRPRRR